MPAEFLRAGRGRSGTVARRFWVLVAVLLVLTVVCSAIAVRLTATPFLAAQQQRAIQDQAQKDARNLESMLARHRQLLTFVAGQPDIVTVVMGYAENEAIVRDYIESLPLPPSLEWLALYDAFGSELAHQNVDHGTPFHFDDRQIAEHVAAVNGAADGVERRVGYVAKNGRAHVLTAVPVKNMGLTEGVLIAQLDFDLAQILPQNDVAERTYFVPILPGGGIPADVPADATVVRVPEIDLAVVLEPDRASVESAGQALLARTVGAITLVLTTAMAVFGWIGRRALVLPHLELEAQKKELAELAAVAQRCTDSILVFDLDGNTIWTNPAFEKLFGYSADEMRGKRPSDVLRGPETDQSTARDIAEAVERRDPIETEIVNYTRDGTPMWVRLSIAPLYNEKHGHYGFMTISHDITEARRQRDAIVAAKKAIEHQAQHDPLTGLPNRRSLDLALAKRQWMRDADATLVRIDLDHFKYVNDTMGHAAGDHVLREVARILREETKSGDLCARVGGDEFVLLLEPGATSRDGSALAERILARIRQPIPFENKTIRVGASFGVASTIDGLLPMEQLISGADSALYEAKEQGRNAVRLYTPALHSRVQDRRSLARELRRAIANEEFEPYFQPQIDARTLEIAGVETLVRWHSPELGRVMPGVFLPVVEQLSAVNDIDDLVFRKAVQYINELADAGIHIPKLSFNVTAERIQSPKLAEALAEVTGRGPRLGFEVLESVLVEEQSDLFNFSLDRLRDLGVSIEVDDFGSGHASIIGLMHLRPDVMKIDQRLIFPITRCEMTRGLVKQIIGMASLMGLKVTAEGVESMEHAQILQDMGCDTFQGFAFARPMTVSELREFARTYRPVLPLTRRSG